MLSTKVTTRDGGSGNVRHGQRRPWRGALLAAVCGLLLGGATVAAAPPAPLRDTPSPRDSATQSLRDSAAPSPATELVADILHKAVDLEGHQRWGEALSLYEDAIRQHPESPQIKRRLQVARFHYDVRRRYADASFLQSLQTMDHQRATDLYREVLQLIDAHYVDAPDWSDILRRGAEGLSVAMTEQPFRSHCSEAGDARIDQFAARLQQVIPTLQAGQRQDAVEGAARIARWAAQEARVPATSCLLEFLCGASASLDTYSTFLTGSQIDEVHQQIEGNFVGLGVELKPRDRDLLIIDVIPGGPAASHGFVAGDRIVGVGESSTFKVPPNQVADLLRGPEGSQVTVHLVRPNGDQKSLTVERRRVDVPSVDAVQLVEQQHGIGYLRINSFQKTTSRDIDTALWKLHREGMRGLIVDVRRNPGGLLEESVEVADRFVNQGTIVSTRGRSAWENKQYRANRTGTWSVPLVVLIDGESASASEIFAAAVRDHGRAVIVGQRSYGKGSVQGIFHLSGAAAGLRLTTAKFYAPSGQGISGEGVTPDLALPSQRNPLASMEDEEPLGPAAKIDVGLWSAIEAARKLILKVETAHAPSGLRAS